MGQVLTAGQAVAGQGVGPPVTLPANLPRWRRAAPRTVTARGARPQG